MVPFTFADHDAFHRTAGRLVAGAAAGGALVYLLSRPFDALSPTTAAPIVVGLAGAAAGHAVRGVKGAVLAGLALSAAFLSPHLFPHHPIFAVLVAGALAGAIFHRLRIASL